MNTVGSDDVGLIDVHGDLKGYLTVIKMMRPKTGNAQNRLPWTSLDRMGTFCTLIIHLLVVHDVLGVDGAPSRAVTSYIAVTRL